MAPLVAAIRCSASIDADASTTNTMRLPILRSRTFCRRSTRSSFSRSPARRPRFFCIGAAARTVASMARSLTFALGSASQTADRRALAALLAHTALAGKVDPPQVEGLERVGGRFISARASSGHPLIAAGGLLTAIRSAGARLGRRVRGGLALGGLRITRFGLGRLGTLLLLALFGWRGGLVWVPAQGLPGPVGKRKGRGVIDVLATWSRMPAIRREGARGAVDDDVCSVSEHRGLDADRGDEARVAGRDADVFHGGDRLRQGPGEIAVGRGELVCELVVASLESGIALGDEHPLVGIADAFDVDAQPEAVEQLRPQLAFFWIHRPDEDEPRWMGERHALALHDVDAHRRGVEEDVDDVVIQ